MSGAGAEHGFGPQHPRFPGFDVLAQQRGWDEVTRRVVLERLDPGDGPRFFTARQYATLDAVLDRLVGQEPGEAQRVRMAAMVDSRMAEGSTDGWHYEDLPRDEEVWRRSLDALEDDATGAYEASFADCSREQQLALLTRIHDADAEERWHGMPASRLWSLWMRYACTAFYSHPAIWNEIGFSGPAYPRGYKNAHVGKREPFEVADAMPEDDPRWNGAS